ncbi:MAG: class I SAM-dependent methyltransferase [bacterium]
MPSKTVVRHFDAAATGYSAFRNAWPLSVVRRQERHAIAEVLRPLRGARVLDAGCGDGEVLSWLAQQGADAIGIDVSYAMTAQCRQGGLVVAIQEIEHLGFAPVFDWVLCLGALEFCDDPGRAIAELAACLRPGGRVVLVYPKQSAAGSLYAAYHRLAHGLRVRLFRRADVITWMSRAGLQEPAVWCQLSLSVVCVAERAAEAS